MASDGTVDSITMQTSDDIALPPGNGGEENAMQQPAECAHLWVLAES
jgi:hypothetical protein